MKARIKDSVCPYCASDLVIDNGFITCQDRCELPQDLQWHPETQTKIDAVVEWQLSQPVTK